MSLPQSFYFDLQVTDCNYTHFDAIVVNNMNENLATLQKIRGSLCEDVHQFSLIQAVQMKGYSALEQREELIRKIRFSIEICFTFYKLQVGDQAVQGAGTRQKVGSEQCCVQILSADGQNSSVFTTNKRQSIQVQILSKEGQQVVQQFLFDNLSFTLNIAFHAGQQRLKLRPIYLNFNGVNESVQNVEKDAKSHKFIEQHNKVNAIGLKFQEARTPNARSDITYIWRADGEFAASETLHLLHPICVLQFLTLRDNEFYVVKEVELASQNAPLNFGNSIFNLTQVNLNQAFAQDYVGFIQESEDFVKANRTEAQAEDQLRELAFQQETAHTVYDYQQLSKFATTVVYLSLSLSGTDIAIPQKHKQQGSISMQPSDQLYLGFENFDQPRVVQVAYNQSQYKILMVPKQTRKEIGAALSLASNESAIVIAQKSDRKNLQDFLKLIFKDVIVENSVVIDKLFKQYETKKKSGSDQKQGLDDIYLDMAKKDQASSLDQNAQIPQQQFQINSKNMFFVDLFEKRLLPRVEIQLENQTQPTSTQFGKDCGFFFKRNKSCDLFNVQMNSITDMQIRVDGTDVRMTELAVNCQVQGKEISGTKNIQQSRDSFLKFDLRIIDNAGFFATHLDHIRHIAMQTRMIRPEPGVQVKQEVEPPAVALQPSNEIPSSGQTAKNDDGLDAVKKDDNEAQEEPNAEQLKQQEDNESSTQLSALSETSSQYYDKLWRNRTTGSTIFDPNNFDQQLEGLREQVKKRHRNKMRRIKDGAESEREIRNTQMRIERRKAYHKQLSETIKTSKFITEYRIKTEGEFQRQGIKPIKAIQQRRENLLEFSEDALFIKHQLKLGIGKK